MSESLHGNCWAARRLEFEVEPAKLRRLIGRQPGGFAIESLEINTKHDGYSVYGIVRSSPADAEALVDAPEPFELLARLTARNVPFEPAPPVPFVGGWVGWMSYEAGRFIEPFARRHNDMPGMPTAFWGVCDGAIVADHARGDWWLVGCSMPSGMGCATKPADPAGLDCRLRELESVARGAVAHRSGGTRHSAGAPVDSTDAGFGVPGDSPAAAGAPRSNLSRDEYRARVERILEYIHAGDAYQVNFAQRFSTQFDGDPWRLYERLCASNPSPFAACFAWDRATDGRARSAVVSSSPELFLEVRGRRVRTRPIKGTRPRVGDPAADAAARHDLETSEKDRAELVMIVDLERNDLGRVCRPGTVRVVSLGETESHPTVFHRVATIAGELRDECTAIDLLRAAYPCGSITGAPKVRAMQIIDELEPDPRGPYCGTIGWIGANGDLSLSVAIRTMAVCDGQVHAWAGGGIVADSDPQAEYEETLAKAEGMRRALAAADAAGVGGD